MSNMYIAGPMRGRPNYNFQEFENVTKWGVHIQNWNVTSPHEIDMEKGRVKFECRIEWSNGNPYRQFQSVTLAKGFDMVSTLKTDFSEILQCDGIVMLEGWQESLGAIKELSVAKWAGLSTHTVHRTPQTYRLSTLDCSEETLTQLLVAHTRGHMVKAS